jgi:hypothetical protein
MQKNGKTDRADLSAKGWIAILEWALPSAGGTRLATTEAERRTPIQPLLRKDPPDLFTHAYAGLELRKQRKVCKADAAVACMTACMTPHEKT